jgi:hypothetical protein
MLHPENARIALRVGFDVEVPEDAKDGDPKDEEDRVPDEEEGDAADEGDEVKEGGYGGEGGSYFCKGLIGDDHQSIVHDMRGKNAGQLICSKLQQRNQKHRGERHTHFPSVYLCSLSALFKSTP